MEETINKLQDKLKPSGWYSPLRWFLFSEDFEKILIKLKEFKDEGRRFTPPLKDVFKPFEQCKYSKLKVVFLFNEPYKAFGKANGFPISCSKETPQLKHFENAVNKPNGYRKITDFNKVAEQGVLLLNVSPTTDIHKTSLLHYKIWSSFMNYLLDRLSSDKQYIFVFIGDKAQKYANQIDDFNSKFIIDDIPSVFNENIIWNYDDVFNKVNKVLIDTDQTPVTW
jgi:uracil DNA glycosylase